MRTASFFLLLVVVTTGCASKAETPVDKLVARPEVNAAAVDSGLLGMPPEFPEGREQVVVQLQRAGNYLLVPLQINGQDAGLFILDTGARQMMLDAKLTEKVKLSALGDVDLMMGTGKIKAPVVPVESLSVGGVRLQRTFAAVQKMAPTSEEMGLPPTTGIIGMDFLGRVPFTLDNRTATLTLYDPATFKAPDTPSFPVMFTRGLPLLRFNLNEKVQGWALMDSGDPGSLIFSRTFATYNHDQFESRHVHPLYRRNFAGSEMLMFMYMDNISLFGTSVLAPRAAIAIGTAPSAHEEYSGIIGRELLRRFCVTLDCRQQKIWAQPTATMALAEWDKPDFNPKTPDLTGMTPLMRAAQDGLEDPLRRFLKAGVDINAFDIPHGVTALGLAASAGQNKIVTLLLEAGADSNLADKRGRTPLLAALDDERNDAASILLGRKPDLEQSDSAGQTALMLACRNGDEKNARTLLKAGVKLDSQSVQMGSALHFSTIDDHVAVAALLVDAGADINAGDNNGITPLMRACQYRARGVAKLLIARGAKTELRDGKGSTALSYAADCRDATIVEMLLKAGANRSTRNNMGETPSDIALNSGAPSVMSILYDWDGGKK